MSHHSPFLILECDERVVGDPSEQHVLYMTVVSSLDPWGYERGYVIQVLDEKWVNGTKTVTTLNNVLNGDELLLSRTQCSSLSLASSMTY